MIKIYTDGSTRKNRQQHAPGAWGFIVIENDKIIHKEASGEEDTTNQRMELQAMIKACYWAARNFDSFTDVCFYSDSAYIINCYNDKWYEKWQRNGWTTSKNGAVKNVDLWSKLIPFFEKANFSFKKVKGHAGDKWNCVIDGVVQEISRSYLD